MLFMVSVFKCTVIELLYLYVLQKVGIVDGNMFGKVFWKSQVEKSKVETKVILCLDILHMVRILHVLFNLDTAASHNFSSTWSLVAECKLLKSIFES